MIKLRCTARLPTVAYRHASGDCYWRSTLAIACSQMDAGQADVMIGRHDKPIAEYRVTEHPSLITK